MGEAGQATFRGVAKESDMTYRRNNNFQFSTTSVCGVPCALIVTVFWCLAAANIAGITTWGTGRVHASTMSGVSWLCHRGDPGWQASLP